MLLSHRDREIETGTDREPDRPPERESAVRPVGRDRELELLRAFTTSSASGGGSLLVVGDAGVGKTVLLHAAATQATSAGTRVMRAAGVEFEADAEISYAGLRQVLFPFCDQVESLSSAYRKALSVGLGSEEGPTPDTLTLANAAIALLAQAAALDPLLIVVDDLQWLDPASAVMLGVIARRLEGCRVGLLGAVRLGEGSLFESSGLDELEIHPLDNEGATTLQSRTRRHLLAMSTQKLW